MREWFSDFVGVNGLTAYPYKFTIVESRHVRREKWLAGTDSDEQLTIPHISCYHVASKRADKSMLIWHQRCLKKIDEEQIRRQWGTRGLNAQMPHTHGLYTFLRQLFIGIQKQCSVS